MKDKDNHSSGHSVAEAEEDIPALASSPRNEKDPSYLVRNNDKLSVSVIIQICICAACVVYVSALLILFIRYVYAHDGDNLKTRMEVGGLDRIAILFGEFMDGHHVPRLSHVGGMIYAVASGQSRASNSEQQADATCKAKENSNDEVLKTLEEDQKEADRNIAYDGSDLIDWIKSNGGFIHPNTRIGLDPTGKYRGVFVKSVGGEDGGTPDGIEKDTIICEIPWELIISPPNYHYNDLDTNCDALHGFYHQLQLGDESKYAPYINNLKNQPDGRIPSEWSAVGKNLLRKILNQDRNVGLRLPPYDALDRFEEEWMKECNGEDTPLARSAFFQFTSRDEDNLMVPFFDMANHSNDPKKLNAIGLANRSPCVPDVTLRLENKSCIRTIHAMDVGLTKIIKIVTTARVLTHKNSAGQITCLASLDLWKTILSIGTFQKLRMEGMLMTLQFAWTGMIRAECS